MKQVLDEVGSIVCLLWVMVFGLSLKRHFGSRLDDRCAADLMRSLAILAQGTVAMFGLRLAASWSLYVRLAVLFFGVMGSFLWCHCAGCAPLALRRQLLRCSALSSRKTFAKVMQHPVPLHMKSATLRHLCLFLFSFWPPPGHYCAPQCP